MKKFQKILVIGAVVATIGAGAFSVSAAAVSPADILAGLTGQTSESIVQQRTDGETYGAIAAEYDVLDEFHDEMTANLEEILAERVADGTLTQERADAILAAHEAREEACDGTGTGLGGAGYGMGLGNGVGGGRGNGAGTGAGRGAGNGAGMGLGNGVCIYDTAE
ncbi:MAG: hypothetical protein PHG73_04590 [Pygmaiobacter sp.]|nr:hypothetical protein [Pygmaiobacter sp.]